MIHQPSKSSEPPSGFQVSSTMWQLKLFMAPKENIAMPQKKRRASNIWNQCKPVDSYSKAVNSAGLQNSKFSTASSSYSDKNNKASLGLCNKLNVLRTYTVHS